MRWLVIGLVVINLIVAAVFLLSNDENTAEVEEESTQMLLVSEVPKPLPLKEVKPLFVPPSLCYVVGPFNSADDAQNLNARARALGFKSRFRNIETTNEEKEYWLYVPPQGSPEKSKEMLTTLLENHVDSYLITEGSLRFGLSAGLFKNQDNATKLQERILALNVPVRMRELTRAKREQWVQVAKQGSVSESLQKRIMGSEEHAQWQISRCDK